MRFKIYLFFFITVLTFGTAKAQEYAEKAGAYIDALAENGRFSGNVLVVKAGKVLYGGYIGYANYAFNIKNTPATRFRIGSITKQFTAYAVLFATQYGDLKLTDHISDYIPEYPKPYGDQITIHQLLTHTSGIPNYTDDESFFKNRACLEGTPEDVMKTFWNKPLDFTPGSKFKYSNSGYYVLGVILDRLENMNYEMILDKILGAIGMRNSGLEVFRKDIRNLSTGYSRLGNNPQKANFINAELAAYSAGAIYSTTDDLYTWNVFLKNQELIPKELMEKYFTPEKEHYAYGWIIDEVDGHQIQWHNGGIDGFVSYIARYPKDDLFIVVLSNYEGAAINKIGKDLAKMAFGQEVAVLNLPKEVKVNPRIFEKYEGTYNVAPGFDLVVTKERNRLMAQATGQDKFQIFPESETMFFFKVVDAKVEFIVDEDGNATEIILHQNGEHRGKKK